MKKEEKDFFILCYSRGSNPYIKKEGITPREIINEPGSPLHYKRAWYFLNKWDGKGWYEWGVTMDLGWFTLEGAEQYNKLINL